MEKEVFSDVPTWFSTQGLSRNSPTSAPSNPCLLRLWVPYVFGLIRLFPKKDDNFDNLPYTLWGTPPMNTEVIDMFILRKTSDTMVSLGSTIKKNYSMVVSELTQFQVPRLFDHGHLVPGGCDKIGGCQTSSAPQ